MKPQILRDVCVSTERALIGSFIAREIHHVRAGIAPEMRGTSGLPRIGGCPVEPSFFSLPASLKKLPSAKPKIFRQIADCMNCRARLCVLHQ